MHSFSEFMEHAPPFDIVVDGLNMQSIDCKEMKSLQLRVCTCKKINWNSLHCFVTLLVAEFESGSWLNSRLFIVHTFNGQNALFSGSIEYKGQR